MRAVQFLLSLTVVATALLATGCEDTPLLGQESDTMTLIASPTTAAPNLTLDPSGVTLFSTIAAQLLSAEGQVLQGVAITFFPGGGTFTYNSCQAGLCTQSPQVCTSNADCSALVPSPVTVETNASGVAQVTLAMTEDDGDSVTVTALTGTLQQSVVVNNPLGIPNDAPDVEINTTGTQPCNSDSGLLCYYNTLTATFVAEVDDPEGDAVTCYEWRLMPSDEANDVKRGPTLISVQETYSVEQKVDVTLAVTDEPGSCSESTVFPSTASTTVYVCENLAPTANFTVTPNPAMLLAGSATVTVNGGNSTDSETAPANMTYSWNCGNGQTPQGIMQTCVYAAPGVFNITLTVTDQGAGEAACARSTMTSMAVTITEP